MAEAVIRKALVAEAAEISKLARNCFWETFSPFNSAEDMNLYINSAFQPEIQAREIENRKIHTFTVCSDQDGPIMGFIQLLESSPEKCVSISNPIELSRFYFSKAAQGKGLAHQAMQACLDYAQSLGFEGVWLGVWEENHRARAFYEKWNYKTVGSHIFQLGNDPQTDLILERAIKDS